MARPPVSLKEKALQLIARREYSRAELSSKLLSYCDPDSVEANDQVERVLERMTELGLLSDERFAESFVRNRAPRMGRQRMAHELRQRGIEVNLANQMLDEVPEEDELTRARQVWVKKFGTQSSDEDAEAELDTLSRAQLAQKRYAREARFLASRGFSADVIRRVLRERGQDEPA